MEEHAPRLPYPLHAYGHRSLASTPFQSGEFEKRLEKQLGQEPEDGAYGIAVARCNMAEA